VIDSFIRSITISSPEFAAMQALYGLKMMLVRCQSHTAQVLLIRPPSDNHRNTGLLDQNHRRALKFLCACLCCLGSQETVRKHALFIIKAKHLLCFQNYLFVDRNDTFRFLRFQHPFSFIDERLLLFLAPVEVVRGHNASHAQQPTGHCPIGERREVKQDEGICDRQKDDGCQ